jgi:mannose-6-phosphate isomerase
MKVGDTYHCKPGTIHRMVAVTDVDVLEVSTPELDDVVRLEDAYGREGTSKA